MMKNKKRGLGVQRPYKKVISPSSDGTTLASSSESGPRDLMLSQVVSRLCRSVVSLTSYHGNTKLRECTGICIETSCPDATSFLTSTLLIPLTWPAGKITESVTIKVRLLNDRIVTGFIKDPEIYVDFFIVSVKDMSGFEAKHVRLDCDMQFEPYRKVAAVCRNFCSGSLRATTGVDLASLSALTSEIMLSTCRIHKAGIGGPLVDLDGNFVGMNCSRTRMKKSPYVRREQILQFLRYHGMPSVRAKEGIDDAAGAGFESEMKEPFYFIPGGEQNYIIVYWP